MKIFLILAVVLMSAQSFADGPLIWSCSKDGAPDAVTVSVNPYSSEDGYIVKINDRQICSELQLPFPFWMEAKSKLYNGVGYEAVDGEYGRGVDFVGESGGIKLIAVGFNDNGLVQIPELNWFFNPGECIRY